MLEHLIKYIKMQITCMYTCERLHLLLILIIKMETGKIGPEREKTKQHTMLRLDVPFLMPLLLLMDIFREKKKGKIIEMEGGRVGKFLSLKVVGEEINITMYTHMKLISILFR